MKKRMITIKKVVNKCTTCKRMAAKRVVNKTLV